MSEKLHPQNHEQLNSKESHEAYDHIEKLGEKLRQDAEKAGEKDRSKEQLEARKSVEKLAISGKEKAPAGAEKPRNKEPIPSAHKKHTYRATMKRIESRLPAYQRTFSKIINNNTVDRISNATGRTVARPSGYLGAGLAAFIGLAVFTYYANNIGFELSGSEFILFAALGWATGLAVEFIYRSLRRLMKTR